MSIALKEALEGAQYTDNSQVSFSEQLPRVIINNWTDVKTLDKTSINTIALANGFTVEYG